MGVTVGDYIRYHGGHGEAGIQRRPETGRGHRAGAAGRRRALCLSGRRAERHRGAGAAAKPESFSRDQRDLGRSDQRGRAGDAGAPVSSRRGRSRTGLGQLPYRAGVSRRQPDHAQEQPALAGGAGARRPGRRQPEVPARQPAAGRAAGQKHRFQRDRTQHRARLHRCGCSDGRRLPVGPLGVLLPGARWTRAVGPRRPPYRWGETCR